MPITLTDVSADTDALAVDYNANLQKMRDKFSTSAGVGIGDADIATDAAISGSKLSTVNQVPTLALATDAVDNRVLRKDPSVSANRPVTADHVRDGVIQKKHIDTAHPLAKAQLDLLVEEVAFSVAGSGAGWTVRSYSVQRVTNGANYEAIVNVFLTNGSGSATGFGSQAVQKAPTTAIPTASRVLLDVYIADLAQTGSSTSVSGKLVFVSMALA